MFKAMSSLSGRVWRRAAPRRCESRRLLSNKAPASTLAQIPAKTPPEKATEKPLGVFSVTISSNDLALAYAEKISRKRPSETKLVLWTDASSLNGEEGPFTWSLVYEGLVADNGSAWKEMTGFLPLANPNLAEFHAISRAQQIALMLIEDRTAFRPKTSGRRSRMAVKIFSDSQAALGWAHTLVTAEASLRTKAMLRLGGQEYCDRFLAENERLRRLATSVQFHWLPRRGAEGNILADKAARRAMEAAVKILEAEPEPKPLREEQSKARPVSKAVLPLLRLTGGVVVASAILLAKFT